MVRKAFLTCGISNAKDEREDHLILTHLQDTAKVENVMEEELDELIPNPFYPAPASEDGLAGNAYEWSDKGDEWWAPGRYEGEEVDEWVASDDDD
ncbi:unnamed protein product [Closterium sp. NIES-64]|nr:unnamed protein product [Closterium sp. NIES-64]